MTTATWSTETGAAHRVQLKTHIHVHELIIQHRIQIHVLSGAETLLLTQLEATPNNAMTEIIMMGMDAARSVLLKLTGVAVVSTTPQATLTCVHSCAAMQL